MYFARHHVLLPSCIMTENGLASRTGHEWMVELISWSSKWSGTVRYESLWDNIGMSPYNVVQCSIENQKGVNVVQCSIENQKGPITINFVQAMIAPFWFSTEYCWFVIMPFWLSTDNIFKYKQYEINEKTDHHCTHLTCWRLFPSMFGLGSMGIVCYSKSSWYPNGLR